MTIDDIQEAGKQVASKMSEVNPFLAWTLIVITVLLAWYVYQQERQNQKMIDIQIQTIEDRRERTSAMSEMTSTIEKGRQSALRTQQNIEQLSAAVLISTEQDARYFTDIFEILQETASKTGESVTQLEKLRQYLQERDATIGTPTQ